MAREIVPDALLEVLGPLLPAPRMPPHGGRPPVPQRAALTGTSFVCPRRASRGSNCPSRWAGAASSRAGGDSATGKLSVFMDLPPQQPLPASAWADLEGPPRCWLPALGRTWHPQKVLPAIAWPDLAPPKSAARHRLAGPGTPEKCCPSPVGRTWHPQKSAARHRLAGPGTPKKCCPPSLGRTWHPQTVLPVTGWPDLAPPKSAARHRFRGDDQNDRHSTSGSVCRLGVCGPRPDEGHSGSMRGLRSVPGAWRASRNTSPSPSTLRLCHSTDWTRTAQRRRVARTPLASQPTTPTANGCAHSRAPSPPLTLPVRSRRCAMHFRCRVAHKR
jgi:hypothetical protein